ncbi:MAG: hypothetical protein KKE02_24235 [Alphaproteobacteria bacterium]|nr:hypothetical protein [Alphaproteobacteria bacterium]MBU1516518.1 hypothetical protein [Alphaproteobacteria bacterium]MBU2094275.1 hypothetical protein [Alphaproteobacteria bacterium]MBU2154148.1 hypothetical protein [Alphaproteobacteria bacterium]MBU2307445.1 hypothetical protein [Alphaproteobacteria bacterium]
MKQYAGEEIIRIMRDMPPALVDGLREAAPEHRITEYEARWWGFLQFARTDGYEGLEFVIPVSGGVGAPQTFLDYVLSVRGADMRAGLVRRTWPETGFDKAA